MSYIGVFRDNFYSPANVLPPGKYSAIATANSGVIPAVNLVGGVETYLVSSGTSTAALTTDSAANISAALTALGVPPANGPVYTGTSWLLKIKNTFSGTLTLTGGTGVSFASSGTNTIATSSLRTYIAAVTGPNLITLTSTDEVTVVA